MGFQQVGGKGSILAATAACLGFLARYGKRWYGPVPNPFKMFSDGLHKTLFHNPVYSFGRKV